MADLVKNCIIFLGSLITIGCIITINKYEKQNKLLFRDVCLEIKLRNLEEKNNKLLAKIDKLYSELTIIKEIIIFRNICIEQQKNTNLINQEIVITEVKEEKEDNIEDNELLDECYDNLQQQNCPIEQLCAMCGSLTTSLHKCKTPRPLSNLKKVYGFKNWFY
jgi:hypothetical protein